MRDEIEASRRRRVPLNKIIIYEYKGRVKCDVMRHFSFLPIDISLRF